MLYQLHVHFLIQINLIKDLMLDTGRFVFLGSGVYHSTELFCDYVSDKLFPPQGWKSYLALDLGGRIVELNH